MEPQVADFGIATQEQFDAFMAQAERLDLNAQESKARRSWTARILLFGASLVTACGALLAVGDGEALATLPIDPNACDPGYYPIPGTETDKNHSGVIEKGEVQCAPDSATSTSSTTTTIKPTTTTTKPATTTTTMATTSSTTSTLVSGTTSSTSSTTTEAGSTSTAETDTTGTQESTTTEQVPSSVESGESDDSGPGETLFWMAAGGLGVLTGTIVLVRRKDKNNQ